MANLADDTEALKQNFFLRRFFKRRGHYNLDRMTPAQYRSGKFVKGNSLRTRLVGQEPAFFLRAGWRGNLKQAKVNRRSITQ